MPAHKKDPSIRRRRNKAATATKLTRRSAPVEPDLAPYLERTVAQLRAMIDERNLDRPDDDRLSKRGTKIELAGRLASEDQAEHEKPALPARPEGWHDLTVQWWDDVWSSPMSDEWDDSDIHNVYFMAGLVDDYWCAETAKQRKDAATEIRLQRADLGLAPYSRRRLEWAFETADEAKDRGEERRQRRGHQGQQPPSKKSTATEDPRTGLYAVK